MQNISRNVLNWSSARQGQQLIAIPLAVLSVLLVVSGLDDLSAAQLSVGAIGLVAAGVLQRKAR
ncbi:hypothetical protein [Pseudomonas sp. nanlin1]|uniref:hypothetical protein n=1 Tax=Pseudomonas sp. nanlin1 TaxID=3040605 RepID=UPI00388E4B6A